VLIVKTSKYENVKLRIPQVHAIYQVTSNKERVPKGELMIDTYGNSWEPAYFVPLEKSKRCGGAGVDFVGYFVHNIGEETVDQFIAKVKTSLGIQP
jgi:hypothetical protein